MTLYNELNQQDFFITQFNRACPTGTQNLKEQYCIKHTIFFFKPDIFKCLFTFSIYGSVIFLDRNNIIHRLQKL